MISVVTEGARRDTGSRSVVGCSHQSTSPACSAAAAVTASGIVHHSMRSTVATFGPAEGVIARHVCRDPDRIEQRQIGLRHEDSVSEPALLARGGAARGRRAGGGSPQEVPTPHSIWPFDIRRSYQR